MAEQTRTSVRPEAVFFLSEIIRRKVVLRDRKIGRLSDMIVVDGDKAAEVTCIVVQRSFGYPSLLVPWTRVVSIDDVITVDIEALEPYEGKPAENMVLLQDHVLDKKVIDFDGNEVEVVYDIQLVLRNRKLYVSGIDSSRYGLLRRIGLKRVANFISGLASRIRDDIIPWMYIEHLPRQISSFAGDVKLKVLKEKLSDIPPVDMADILEELDHEQRVAIFKQLENDHASDTLEEIEPRVQRELISSLKKEKVAGLLNQMTPVQAADILAILPVADANDIMKLMDAKSSQKAQLILQDKEQKNIDFATPKFIKFPPETPVRQVIDYLRTAAADKDVITYIYVVGPDDVLLGVLDLRELLRAGADERLGDIMNRGVRSLSATSTLYEASEMFKHYGFRAIPLTDDNNRIVGVVTYRDVMNLKRVLIVE